MDFSCLSVVDRSTTSYDITFKIRLDETFTPAVISAIENLQLSSFVIDERGNAVEGVATDRRMSLGPDVTHGPVTIDVQFDDFPQLTGGLGYSLTVSVCITLLLL